jgi:hypothetical protein
MASEILGMFGQNPQQMRNEYMDRQRVSPSQMGSQGLLQQVVSMGGNAGANIGGAIGGLLGGAAPGEREAMAMQQAMQASSDPSMTQAQRMRRMAEILSQQPGMGAQAMQAMTEARRLEAEDFTMAAATEKGRTREVNRQFETTDPLTQKKTSRTGKVTQVDTGRKDEKGNIVWEDLEGSGAPTPAGEGDKPLTEKEKAQAQLDKNKAAREGKDTPTAAATPQSVADLVATSTSNNSMAALEKQAQAERANATYEAEAKNVTNLPQLTPAVIAGLTREQAVDVFKKYSKNLTEEQKNAILEKAGVNRYQNSRQDPYPARPRRTN